MHTAELIYCEDSAVLDALHITKHIEIDDPTTKVKARELILHSRTLTQLLGAQGIKINPVVFLRENV